MQTKLNNYANKEVAQKWAISFVLYLMEKGVCHGIFC